MKRQLDPKRLEQVRKMPCIVCKAPPPSDPHHPKGHRWGCGMGRKADDRYVIPLCQKHHDAYHRYGVKTWEEKYGTHEQLLDKTNDILHCVS